MKKAIIILAALLMSATVALAQAPDPPAADYVGSAACQQCHKTQHTSWAASLHPRMIQDPRTTTETVMLADFGKLTTVVTDTKTLYTAQDVVYTMGWRYRQRYIVRDAKTKRLVLGAGQWNIAGSGPISSDQRWQKIAGGDDWLIACAGCHVTGLDLAAAQAYKVGDKELPFVELGVGCEACHGPGGDHLQNPTKDNIPVNKLESLDATLCGQCHTRGNSPVIDGVKYGYPVGYTPGAELTEKNFVPVKPTKLDSDPNWWLDGHAKRHRQEYLEWQTSRHAGALQTIQKISDAPDTCLRCHSTDYRMAMELQAAGDKTATAPTVKTAQYGLTCQVCHTPHQSSTRPYTALLRSESYHLCTGCHNDTQGGVTPWPPGDQAQQPMQEIYEGRGAFDVPYSSSPHFTSQTGPICASCHMPGTATSADIGDIATHNWKIVRPTLTQPDEPNACTACHANPEANTMQITLPAMIHIIESRQTEIKDKLTPLSKLIKNLKSARAEWDSKASKKSEQQNAFEKAVTNVSLVENEGSFGIHNYEYSKAILAKAEQQLGFAATPPTPTPTLTPTPTATPTTTPLPPTPTPIPPPGGGTTWPIWSILVAVIIITMILLIIRAPKPA